MSGSSQPNRIDIDMKVNFNIKNKTVANKMKRVTLLDIETSLVDVRVFGTGKQFINIDQFKSRTRLLTVAGGTLYDLHTKGASAVWAYGNHMYDSFETDPLDDTDLLDQIWGILDDSDVIVAHNAAFDKGWLHGRFLELGWNLPSPYKVVCTYRGLTGYNMNSKKLDSLSHTLVGTAKIKTDFRLWDRCSDGDRDAFEEMMKYNIGDIFDTLFQVYVRTAAYYPKKCVDLSIPGTPSCKVSGQLLVQYGTITNDANGMEHDVYLNEELNIYYKERVNNESKKKGQGRLVPM